MDNPINIKWMKRAINLASLGTGLTSPNPLVGAVLIDKFGNLISEGFHHKAGMPHAEAMVFNNLKKESEGSSLYVNLEPCCHQGKTPPCVKRIIDSGVKKVYISIKDPDKRVAGKGIEILQNAGIEVFLGLCEKESLEINRDFIHRNLTGKSYGVLKWAMSIDGRIGLKNGKSKWITSNFARSEVHSFRSDFDAIIIGGNTLRKDDPLLTTRGKKEKEPLRVVFSKSLNLPKKCNLWDTNVAKTIVIYDSSSAKEEYLNKIPSSIEVIKISCDNPVHISSLLAQKGYNKVLWECGPKLATTAIKEGCIQELITFISPKILGGVNAMNPLADFGFENMNEIINLRKLDMQIFEDDICLKNKFLL